MINDHADKFDHADQLAEGDLPIQASGRVGQGGGNLGHHGRHLQAPGFDDDVVVDNNFNHY